MSEATVVSLPSPASLRDKVGEIAKANPEFVYKPVVPGQCRYEQDGEGSCLLGQALAALGVPTETLREIDNESGPGIHFPSIDEVYKVNGVEKDEDVQWLADVQVRQDCDLPWGKAVEAADARMSSDDED